MAAAEAKPLRIRKHSEKQFPSQDDDYRAPNPLSTPSTSSSNLECVAAPFHRAHGSDSPTQPNFQHRKDFTIGRENALQAEVDDLSIGIVYKTAVFHEEHQNIREFGYRTCKKYDAADKSVNTTTKTDSMDEFWYTDDHFMDLDSLNNFVSKKGEKLSFDLQSHWTEAEKTKPWWRSTGKDELASLVAKKSLENIENCDLPQPRSKHHGRVQSACLKCFDQDYFNTSSFTEMQFSSLDRYNWGIHSLASLDKSQSIAGSLSHSRNNRGRPFSSRNEKEENMSSISNADSSIAELLEALCHSQTRAREAEKAAQQADTEKKHIISLFLKQASQLFAYKQLFKLLQLQNILPQLRNKDEMITGLFPDASPWLHQHKNKRKKHGRIWYENKKYYVVLAVGMGLVSAGLLLGWTMGWLFPTL